MAVFDWYGSFVLHEFMRGAHFVFDWEFCEISEIFMDDEDHNFKPS